MAPVSEPSPSVFEEAEQLVQLEREMKEREELDRLALLAPTELRSKQARALEEQEERERKLIEEKRAAEERERQLKRARDEQEEQER
jgi:hypothetical protein